MLYGRNLGTKEGLIVYLHISPKTLPRKTVLEEVYHSCKGRKSTDAPSCREGRP